MPSDYETTIPTAGGDGNDSPSPAGTGLNESGIRAMQGFEPEAQGETADPPLPSLVIEEDGKQIPLEEYTKAPYDPSELRYETRSPHEDYQNYKDVVTGQRRYEIGQQAATADSLPDAIDATLDARAEAKGSDETPMDEYFYLKHGRTPYTTDTYPQLTDEDQPQSYTDEDILRDEMEQLRQQQEEDLQEDLEKYRQRPKPPYYKE